MFTIMNKKENKNGNKCGIYLRRNEMIMSYEEFNRLYDRIYKCLFRETKHIQALSNLIEVSNDD